MPTGDVYYEIYVTLFTVDALKFQLHKLNSNFTDKFCNMNIFYFKSVNCSLADGFLPEDPEIVL
jgi:hypothetical protein